MTPLSIEEKKAKIAEHEEKMARRLARRVIEKPIPPIWMILIPVFFVFHAWKIKQYSNGLKDFTSNYLTSRRQALALAAARLQNGEKVEIDKIVEATQNLPADARPHYRDLLSLLIDHYLSLLAMEGDSHAALAQAHYRSKMNYLLFCVQRNRLEDALNLALSPRIEGESEDIHEVIEKMRQCLSELCRREAGEIFS